MKDEDAPNLSTKDFLNMPVNDAESLRSKQPSHILKVLGNGGPGEGAFFKTPLPPEIYIPFPNSPLCVQSPRHPTPRTGTGTPRPL